MSARVARSNHSDGWQLIGEELEFHHGRWSTGDGWVHLEQISDGLRCSVLFTDGKVTGVKIQTGAGEILTARALRAFPLGQVEEAARRRLSGITQGVGATYYATNGRLMMVAAGELQLERITEMGMAAVAALYCERCEVSRHAASELAEELSTTKQRIHHVLRQASRRGLFDRSHLPKGGVAGGRLTESARALLENLEG